LWIDRWNSIDGPRHGRGRNSGALCDFTNIHEMGRIAGREYDQEMISNRAIVYRY
jgi:hypothetical protein